MRSTIISLVFCGFGNEKKKTNNNAFNAYGVAVMLGLSATSTTVHNAAIKEMLKMGK